MFSMVNYTLTLKQLIDNNIDIGLKDYPIWDENYRKTLNDKIINHYYLREIGQETPGLFIHYLNMKMKEIMPYYCELYKTTQYEYNPIHNADYTDEYTKTNKDTQTSKSNTEGESNSKGSTNGSTETTNTSDSNNTTNTSGKNAKVDTPQSVLEVNDIDSLNVATELDFAKQNGNEIQHNETTSNGKDSSNSESESSNKVNSNAENTNDGLETYKRHLQGNYGVKSTQAMIQEERDIILNIDMLIIAELNTCFMQIW